MPHLTKSELLAKAKFIEEHSSYLLPDNYTFNQLREFVLNYYDEIAMEYRDSLYEPYIEEY